MKWGVEAFVIHPRVGLPRNMTRESEAKASAKAVQARMMWSFR